MALVKIITGAYNSGKTTTAEKLLKKYLHAGQRAAGWISEAEYTDGKKDSYYIRDITTGRRELAVSALKPESGRWVHFDFSRFYFSEDAFDLMNAVINGQVLTAEPDSRPDAVFIDELGPLELSGRGAFPAVERLLKNYNGTVYLVVRQQILDHMTEKLGLKSNDLHIIKTKIN